jgi:hypothetical protein
MEQNGLFAQVNDSIRTLASQVRPLRAGSSSASGPEITCHALVSLTLTEFDAHRPSSPPMPVLATEHAG